MNDKEILEKYKKEIDTDIQRYYQENGIKQDIVIVNESIINFV